MSPTDPHAAHAQPTAVYQAVPAAPAPVAPAPRRQRTALVLGLALVALFALLAGGILALRAGSSAITAAPAGASVAASSSGPGTTAATNDPTSTVADAPTAVADPAPVSTGGAGNGNGAGTGTGAGKGAGSGGAATPAPKPAPTTAPKPAGPAPAITSFSTPDSIDCHNDDSPMFSASWTTTNAVKTTIAIDGPGIYKTYGPNASDSLPFNCSSPHTFKLTAFGQDGKTVSKTITLQPRNVRPPATPDTDQ